MEIAETNTEQASNASTENDSPDTSQARSADEDVADARPDGAQADPVAGEAVEAEPTGEVVLPLDQVFDILKNKRRRIVLRYLNEAEGSVKLGALSEYVASVENDIEERAVSSDQRKRVYVGLYQCHLPKMDDMDIVDFNQNRGIIELGANAPQLDEYLELADGTTRNWPQYYAAVAVFGLAIMGLSVAVGGLGTSVLAAFGVFNLLLLTTSLVHLRES